MLILEIVFMLGMYEMIIMKLVNSVWFEFFIFKFSFR